MIHTLSILIPTYNNVCLELVKTLQAQASALSDFEYEILVADDGSTDLSTVKQNRAIRAIPYCQYLEREKNVGRSAIRNFLAKEAKYTWLLFIDSDLHVTNPQFIKNYILSEGVVVVGGLKIGGNPQIWADNLRYRYEKACEIEHNYLHRIKKEDREFRTTNFLISKQVIAECPFDENFKYYGYEDVLLGKNIADKGYHITHIDNPILLDEFEDNYHFLLKTEEACRTLYLFRKELKGYSKLIAYQNKLHRIPFFSYILKKVYPLCCLHIKAHLMGKKPNVKLYNIYKLLYYIHLQE